MTPEVQTTPCPHCGKLYASHTRICPDDGSVLEHASPLTGQVGAVLDGKYRLDGFLSKGGMGAVYRATHVMLGKTVAVKLINPELVTSPEVVRRFQREARAATTLNHLNIVAVYDLGQTADGTLYIAMEFIDGPSLKEVIQRSHGLTPDRAVTLLRQVASALSLAHRNGIIHRDLKPHNIMLAQSDDGRDVVKLVDFGIAKTFDEGTKLTSTGLPIGTPHYMSPEQASGAVVDARSDLYSVGVILYEMLTGKVPFDGDSTPVILIKHLNEPPIAPSIHRSGGVPPALDAIVLRLLQKDPANRFQSADELAAALDQAGAAIPVHDVAQPMSGASASPHVRVTSAETDASTVGPTVITSKHTPAASTAAPTSAPAGSGTRVQASFPTAAPTGSQVPPTPAHQTVQVAATGIPAQAASVSAPQPDVQLPPPSAVPAGQPASKLSSVVVLSVLVVGVIAALGAAYYLNSIAGRSSSTQVATTAAPETSPPASLTPPPPPTPESQPPPSSTASSAPAQAPTARVESPPVAATSPPPTPVPNSPVKSPTSTPSGGGAANPSSAPPAGAPQPPRTTASAPPAAAKTTTATEPPQRVASTTVATPAPPSTSPPPAPVARGVAAGQVARREESVQAAAGFPEKPAVYFRCAGPAEICNPLRSAVDDALGSAGLTSVRRVNVADVDVSAQVEVVQQNIDRQFGQTFATRTYSVVLSGETTKTGEVVAMPHVDTISFDQRVGSERATERSRLISAAVVERVQDFAAKKRAR